jgi:energy-coupling factor transporter ATP-binding protein EcfA2
MKTGDLLSMLTGVRRSGDGHVALCPAHDDRNPSLSVSTGDDGRILLHCHAGCQPASIVQALGLSMADLAPPKPEAGQRLERRHVATYDYTDEGGVLLYQVLRYAPKDFLQRRPDGHGGWSWTLRNVRRVLFRLPDLRGRGDVCLVEGEKDAERLFDFGIAATTACGGAGKWRPEYVDQLREAGVTRVYVFADADDAGRKHAASVAASCHAGGLETRCVDLPGLKAIKVGADVTDWLDAGHTPADLAACIKAASLYVPIPKGNSKTGAVLVRMQDVEPEAIAWLWERRLARRKLTLLVGDGGLGKSTVALAMAAVLSRGSTWPDGAIAPCGATVILNAEDGLSDTIRPRLISLDADCHHIHALPAIRTGNGERPFSLARDLAELERAIRETSAAFVVIDPIGAYFGSADSYKDTEVRGVLAPLAALADRTGACVLGVMHISKGTERSAQHRVLGSVGFVNSARIVLAVGCDPNDQEPATERRVLVPIKQNICAPAAPVAFTVGDGGLVWSTEPVAALSAEDVLSGRPTTHDEDTPDAASVIAELLADETWPLPARVAEDAAKANGISIRSLQRAARRKGIQPRKVGSRWLWFRQAERERVALSSCVAFAETGHSLQGDRQTTTRHAPSDTTIDKGVVI